MWISCSFMPDSLCSCYGCLDFLGIELTGVEKRCSSCMSLSFALTIECMGGEPCPPLKRYRHVWHNVRRNWTNPMHAVLIMHDSTSFEIRAWLSQSPLPALSGLLLPVQRLIAARPGAVLPAMLIMNFRDWVQLVSAGSAFMALNLHASSSLLFFQKSPFQSIIHSSITQPFLPWLYNPQFFCYSVCILFC